MFRHAPLPFCMLLLAGAFACNHTKNIQKMRSLSGINAGTLEWDDGSTQPIAHWGDSTATVIICVRHCEKAKDDSNDPDLTPEGQARAERLGRILARAGLDTVFTTQYKRTRQTGEAVQRHSGGATLRSFQADAQETWLRDLLRGSGGKQYLYVGHQSTVPQLLNQLTRSQRFYNIPDHEFGLLYIAVIDGNGACEVLECRY